MRFRISLILLLSGYILFLSGCKTVNKEDINEITVFVGSFYDFLTNDLNVYEIKEYFLNGNIEFYIQDNSSYTTKIVIENSATQFVDIYNDFISENKHMTKIEMKNIKFKRQPYDVPMGDLFVVECTVIYGSVQTSETFFIKKKNHEYKIYRYFINYSNVNNYY